MIKGIIWLSTFIVKLKIDNDINTYYGQTQASLESTLV